MQRGFLAKVVKYNISNFLIHLPFFLGSPYKLHPAKMVKVILLKQHFAGMTTCCHGLHGSAGTRVNGDHAFLWELAKFDPSQNQNPVTG